MVFLFGALASAYEGFRCIPSMRETRIQVLVVDQNIQILVNNGMGYNFMPQFDGPSSIFNLSFNKMQGEDLKDLGDSFMFNWPKSACVLNTDRFTIVCRSEASNQVKSIKSFGITTAEITEKYEQDVYEKRRFRLALEKDNIYFVALEFNSKSCEKFN